MQKAVVHGFDKRVHEALVRFSFPFTTSSMKCRLWCIRHSWPQSKIVDRSTAMKPYWVLFRAQPFIDIILVLDKIANPSTSKERLEEHLNMGRRARGAILVCAYE